MSSGTLRGWSTNARAQECENITGLLDVSRAASIVSGRHMRQVDDDAELIHPAHDLAPELGQPAGARHVGGRVRPDGVVVVREREIADA